MDAKQPLSHLVESYRIADIVTQWARERLEHETIVANALARGVICDGLRIQSIDGRWANSKPIAFRGYPFVGYAARPDSPMSILRASALNHLIGIVERGEEPDLQKLHEEFIYRDDFRAWLLKRDLPLPGFWSAPGTAAR